MDLHAAQIQGFFDIPVDHLYAAPVLDDYFSSLGTPPEKLCVVSPDEGSIKRALRHSAVLGGTLAIVDKRRSSADKTSQANLIGGPVEGKTALLFDDMISTAGSICGAAAMVKKAGAEKIYLAATHGILCGNALENIDKAPIERACDNGHGPAIGANGGVVENHGAEHRAAVGRGHQANPPQRIGEFAIRLAGN